MSHFHSTCIMVPSSMLQLIYASLKLQNTVSVVGVFRWGFECRRHDWAVQTTMKQCTSQRCGLRRPMSRFLPTRVDGWRQFCISRWSRRYSGTSTYKYRPLIYLIVCFFFVLIRSQKCSNFFARNSHAASVSHKIVSPQTKNLGNFVNFYIVQIHVIPKFLQNPSTRTPRETNRETTLKKSSQNTSKKQRLFVRRT